MKGNQPKLQTLLKGLKYDFQSKDKNYEQFEKGHGRRELRRITVTSALPIDRSFPFISQAFRIERERVSNRTGEIMSDETVYGITSLSADDASPEKILSLNRGHWKIENSSHYVRDVTYREDFSNIHKGSGPLVMTTLRNLVISLFRILGFTNIKKGIDDMCFNRHIKCQLRCLGIV